MSKVKIILMALAAGLAAFGFAQMASAEPEFASYSNASFAAAQAEGRSIVVEVHADWCPTCRAQQPILDELRSDARMADVLFVRVDWDTQKDFIEAHRIPRQSTIVVFQGADEQVRSIAETDRSRLRALILGAV